MFFPVVGVSIIVSCLCSSASAGLRGSAQDVILECAQENAVNWGADTADYSPKLVKENGCFLYCFLQKSQLVVNGELDENKVNVVTSGLGVSMEKLTEIKECWEKSLKSEKNDCDVAAQFILCTFPIISKAVMSN